ncbi:MAG: hypothetical protein ACFE8B_08400 [Candidatus Hermodarchaeota archaeon]
MDNPFTTVVGSWPLDHSNENMEKVFTDLIQTGIDYPCYPQLTSMISQFLDPLTQCITPLEKDNNRYYLSNDFKVPNEPVALEYGKFITNYLRAHPQLQGQIKGTKACLTGPLTLTTEILLKEELASGIKPRIFTEPRGIMVDWIVEKFAEIMKQIGKAYNEMGINIISMDEPILGFLVGRKTIFHSEDFILDILNKTISEIKSLSSIHVCGRISPKCRDLLLQTDVNILDHEFRTNEDNFNIFQKKHFTETNKFLAIGTVKSKFQPISGTKIDDYVESIDSLVYYIRSVFKQYGKENLIIKPDCGFEALKGAFKDENFAYEIAIRKIKNMVQALRKVEKYN